VDGDRLCAGAPTDGQPGLLRHREDELRPVLCAGVVHKPWAGGGGRLPIFRKRLRERAGIHRAFLLYQISGDTNYLAKARAAYDWERENLFDPGTVRFGTAWIIG